MISVKISKLKQYKNANIVNFVYYGKNSTDRFLAITTINFVKPSFLPPANENMGKVIFSQVSVILFTGRGRGVMMSLRYGQHPPPWTAHPLDTPTPATPGQHIHLWTTHAPTVKKRAVHILLECFLVFFFFKLSARADLLVFLGVGTCPIYFTKFPIKNREHLVPNGGGGGQEECTFLIVMSFSVFLFWS